MTATRVYEATTAGAHDLAFSTRPELAEAVRFARANDLQVSVHSLEGSAGPGARSYWHFVPARRG